MKTLHPKIHLTDPRFNYVSAAKTDISLTFERVKQDLKFSDFLKSQREPLVSQDLNSGELVLSAQPLELE
jgi:hypothetical protein